MRDSKRIVYTGGTFDLFHWGHISFLQSCQWIAGEGGQVVVALNEDKFVQQFKGKLPVQNYYEREAALSACRYVDKVVRNTDGDSKATVLRVNPDFIVVGSDWAKKDYYAQMGFDQNFLDARGILLVYIPYTEGISSTNLKARILES